MAQVQPIPPVPLVSPNGNGTRAHAVTTVPVQTVEVPAVVRRPATVTRLHLGSVARLAVVFWTLAGLLVVGTLFATWAMLSASGTVEKAESFVADLTGAERVQVMSEPVLVAVALGVSLFVVAAVTLTIAGAVFYNVVALVVGGVRVTISETAAPVGGDSAVVIDGEAAARDDEAAAEAAPAPEER